MLIDEVRVSRGARSFATVPDAPFTPDADTVGLWHFDEEEQAANDQFTPCCSRAKTPVLVLDL